MSAWLKLMHERPVLAPKCLCVTCLRLLLDLRSLRHIIEVNSGRLQVLLVEAEKANRDGRYQAALLRLLLVKAIVLLQVNLPGVNLSGAGERYRRIDVARYRERMARIVG